jgi:hypothetical protein
MANGASFRSQLPGSPVHVPTHKTTRFGHKAACARITRPAAFGQNSTRSHKAADSAAGSTVEKSQIGIPGCCWAM